MQRAGWPEGFRFEVPDEAQRILERRPSPQTAPAFTEPSSADHVGPTPLAQSRLSVRTVIYRSCQVRRQGRQAEGALPATVAPAGEVRGTGRQARPFLFGGLGNLLPSAPAKPSADVSRAD